MYKRQLGACTEFAIPEVHSGIFIDEGCAINRAYWNWKKTGAVNEFEEVGRAVFKILEDPWGGSLIYLDADERMAARKEKGTVAGRDRRQLLEAAGLLGISAFATSLFGTFERMLGVGGEASNDVRTHMNTVTCHVGVIGNQLAALEQSVAGAQENSFHTARRAAFDRECREIFGIRDLAMQQVSSLLRGLAELRSEGRASPTLIHSEDM